MAKLHIQKQPLMLASLSKLNNETHNNITKFALFNVPNSVRYTQIIGDSRIPSRFAGACSLCKTFPFGRS